MRQYQAAWLKLKEEKKLILMVLPSAVRRVKKAIIKEKDMDTLLKIETGWDQWIMQSSYDPLKKLLVLKLRLRFGLD